MTTTEEEKWQVLAEIAKDTFAKFDAAAGKYQLPSADPDEQVVTVRLFADTHELCLVSHDARFGQQAIPLSTEEIGALYLLLQDLEGKYRILPREMDAVTYTTLQEPDASLLD